MNTISIRPNNARNAAHALRRLANSNISENEVIWGADSAHPCPDMIRGAWADSTDYRKVAKFVESGRFQAAQNIVWRMDTLPRENVLEVLGDHDLVADQWGD